MKRYVIRKGKENGIFTSRDAVKPLVSGFVDAKFKSFSSEKDALEAFNSSREQYYGQGTGSIWKKYLNNPSIDVPFDTSFIAVDAACSGNPGKLEYRGVEVRSGKELFHYQFEMGTNNIGEFLAIVEGMKIKGCKGIYSDSKIAMSWINEGKCKSLLRAEQPFLSIWKTVDEAEERLKNQISLPIVVKRKTNEWGEIPADFGRK
ncbi:ribonuclease H [candidate division SR1 bacterium]|nr:ribonuclease H [candidate division SR1 bacterium]